MHNQLRTIPRSLAVAALSLLATTSFTVAPLADGAPARPEDDGSPIRLESSIQSGCEVRSDCPTR
jgi:hypothetical protein